MWRVHEGGHQIIVNGSDMHLCSVMQMVNDFIMQAGKMSGGRRSKCLTFNFPQLSSKYSKSVNKAAQRQTLENCGHTGHLPVRCVSLQLNLKRGGVSRGINLPLMNKGSCILLFARDYGNAADWFQEFDKSGWAR